MTSIDLIEKKLQEESVQRSVVKFTQLPSSRLLVFSEDRNDISVSEHFEFKGKDSNVILFLRRDSKVITRLCGHVHIVVLPCDLGIKDVHVMVQSLLVPLMHALTNASQKSKADMLRVQTTLNELDRLLSTFVGENAVPELGICFNEHIINAAERGDGTIEVDGRFIDKLQGEVMTWIRNIRRIKHRILKTPPPSSLTNEIVLWTTFELRMRELQNILITTELGTRII